MPTCLFGLLFADTTEKIVMSLSAQICYLFLLAIPIACIAWTVTQEEVFREPREFCIRHSKKEKWVLVRKFFYLFTCEYCFSHYVTIGMLFLTRFHLLFEDWRGYVISWFALVWIANIYMSLFAFIRTDLKKEKLEVLEKEKEDVSKPPLYIKNKQTLLTEVTTPAK
jgi:hypothetical protein